MKNLIIAFIIFSAFKMWAQVEPDSVLVRSYEVNSKTIQIDTVSIRSNFIEVYAVNGGLIPAGQYSVDFSKAVLHILTDLKDFPKTIHIHYLVYPEFLTSPYSVLDPNIISERTVDLTEVYYPKGSNKRQINQVFGDLNTSGSISRSVTVGNNQDAVVNSNFNLQIEGKLSNDISLRASISDNNIPLREGGYTQRLQDFDRIYMEVLAKQWNLQGGDLNLVSTQNNFLRFNKKITGIYVGAQLPGEQLDLSFFASGGLVRGKFSTFLFTGVEGNQGPYKIFGQNNEQSFFILSGSETVYVNGVPLNRGENQDYIIDYVNAEIIFTPLFQVTSNMRFTVDYQIAENNYTRFITSDGLEVGNEKFSVQVAYYNETDAKNRSANQDLTDEQKEILSEAGNDRSKMVSPSATPSAYSENKNLYKKITENGVEFFEYSNNENEELFEVRFTFVGRNNGDYEVLTTLAPGRVYIYKDPINNIKQGSYAAVVQLVAPESLQVLDFNARYSPKENAVLRSELAISRNDQNLFSSMDDENNNGFAGKINYEQLWFDRKWDLKSNLDYEYVTHNFKTVERYRNIEFLRDWNLIDGQIFNQNDQSFFNGSFEFSNKESNSIIYQIQQLKFEDAYQGFRHNLFAKLKLNRTALHSNISFLNSESPADQIRFLRGFLNLRHDFKGAWVGFHSIYESNEIKEKNTENFNPLSHKIADLEGFFGFGDSARAFVQLGYQFQQVDSVQQNALKKVNHANNFYIRGKWMPLKNGELLYTANYRTIDRVEVADEESINGRLQYNQNLFKNLVQFNTIYQTQSGVLPQQDFSYVEVEPGKGYYAWKDFNENGIQELDEFVVANFPDEAIYVRVLLPNIRFTRSHQNKFSQSINVQANKWQNELGFKKVISHFSDQFFYLIQSNEKRDGGSINFNPFRISDEDLLSLDKQFRNSFFYNRGLQKWSTGYVYANNRKRTFFSVDNQDITLRSHQFLFDHRLSTFWLFDFKGEIGEVSSSSEVFLNRNYSINQHEVSPQISFINGSKLKVDFGYTFKNKENQMAEFELLKMHRLSLGGNLNNSNRYTLVGNFSYISNQFEGNQNSVVGYQMLEGLQPGENLTWLLNFQKRIFKFLDLNLNYSGRKSANSRAIHTGTVQLRASF